MKSSAEKSDPIRDNYFSKVAAVGKVSQILFYLSTFCLVLMLVIDKQHHHLHYGVIASFSVVVSIFFFLLDSLNQFYLLPVAEEKRRQDFLSHTWGVKTIHEHTKGYYDKITGDPLHDMSYAVLENSFYTLKISGLMLNQVRFKVVFCFAVFLLLVLQRETDLDWIVMGSQLLFGERIVANWLRLELLQSKARAVFERVYRVSVQKTRVDKLNIVILESLLTYEASKASSGILLSENIFFKYQNELLAEWGEIRSKVIH